MNFHGGKFMYYFLIFIVGFLMPIKVFSSSTFSNQLVYRLRDPQTSPKEFRETLVELGQFLAGNILEELPLVKKEIITLTGAKASHEILDEDLALVTILRAGLPLNEGVMKVFPHAEVGFIGMSRVEKTLTAKTEYIALPDLQDKIVILSDTMLATGGSMIEAIEIVKRYHPKKIVLVIGIASQKGMDRIVKYDPSITIKCAMIDPLLNDQGYIVPGLGDAGNRCYGVKIQDE